ncbi:type IV-A pilus assembly ATPase PilB [Patescibacteria group bacterium]
MNDQGGRKKQKIGELLVQENLITPVRLQGALAEHTRTGKRLGTILVESGDISQQQLAEALSKHYEVPSIDLSEIDIDPEVIKFVSQKVAEKYLIIPVNRVASDLIVAMADPSNMHAVDAVEFQTGYSVEVVVATEQSIKEAIEKYYRSTKNNLDDAMAIFGDDEIETISESEEALDTEELKNSSEQAPVVKLVNVILTEAIRKGASDIHLEPYEKSFRVRYRIDGRLYEMGRPAIKLKDAMTSRIKIMANLDIADRRVPQDGRFKLKFSKGEEMDFRVSVFPTIYGEKVVLRLLDKSNLQLDMTRLGFEEEQLVHFKKAISRPYGMVLVTGPTGSGKTTTLYSALSELNQEYSNISTIEDPVEFNLPGINQGQVNEDVGLTFAAALRSFLRQDPDIIMVGEIRDFETAEIAVKAALTGHLVLSTLHTNDASSTISRLLNMGIESFLVSSAVDTVLAQRLVRKVCTNCQEQITVSEQALEDLQILPADAAGFTMMEGKGCVKCNNTGYKGRIALYEVMVIDEHVQDLILNGATTIDIKKAAIRLGMLTMRQSGILRIKDGTTTIGEVIKSTAAD